ncbi:uncharacterized protein LOC117557285 isoform X2 [Gymnodraco acuticeps]|uniref:Uncharacterized protein LOC117557285 isoform X2 n=1 Tax=Gymnodraco acuticeps TaxID=8218 RepID=A0A6P8VUC5_GYMAC|nr:uncharacterized protein LOC117557285 isoform X2 [Gymnodraco acuticeps]
MAEQQAETAIHPTVYKGDALITPLCEGANKYKCKFCSKVGDYGHIAAHLQTHRRTAVKHGGFTMYRCNGVCCKSPHFHCCYCGEFRTQPTIRNHVQKCAVAACSVGSLRQTATVSSAASQIATASVASTPLQAISRSKVVQSRAKRTTCPLCKTELYMKNLKTHVDRRHSSSVPDITSNRHLPSQCLDLKKGIFAVGRTFSGLRNPIHVQKFTWGNSHQVVCELENCKQASDFSRRSNLLGFECIHVRSLIYCPTSSKPDVTLKEEVLSDMVEKKWISDNTKRMCLVRKEKAESGNSPLSKVVTFCSGASRVYVSVLETYTSYYSRLGRVSVCYDIKRNAWQCPCSKPNNSCAHKSIAKWHLNQTRPELFLKVRSTDNDVFETFVESDPEGHSTEDILYPPERAALTSLVLYWLDHKKLPAVPSTDACSPQNY